MAGFSSRRRVAKLLIFWPGLRKAEIAQCARDLKVSRMTVYRALKSIEGKTKA